MFRTYLLRGVAAGALSLPLIPPAALAQQSLPTIEVGARAPGRAPSAPSAGGGAGTRGVASGTSGGASSSSDLPKYLQSGGRLTGYAVAGPVASTKTNIPIMQTPYSVQTVTRQTMDDRQDISVQEALLTNVSGISLGGNLFYDNVLIRGFDTRNSFFRNGLRQEPLSNLETVNLQSIEVLKGPAAMLYGRVQPGGMVNLVPKRPLPVPYYSIHEQAGNFGTSRTTLDATGPLTEDKTLLYRTNFSYFRTDTFRDFGNRETYMIAPTVTWRPTERFTLNVDGEYSAAYWVDDLGDMGIPAIGRQPANIPISRYLSDPNITNMRNGNERGLFAYDWTYQFEDDWSITNRFSYQNSDYRQRIAYPASLNEQTGQLTRGLWIVPGLNGDNPWYRRNLATNIDLKGKVVTGPFTHNLLAGFDYYNLSAVSVGVSGPAIAPINIYFPIYSPINLYTVLAAPNNRSSVTKDQWKGLYLQDQISFWDDRVHILLSGRHDWAEAGGRAANEALFLTYLQRVVAPLSVNSPMAGVLVQPLPWLSIYGNYTRSYGTINGQNQDNTPLPPQIGVQYEGGVKAELLDKRLIATFAYFDIFRKNVARGVPGTQFIRVVGEAESHGVEFDLNGRIDDNWSVIATYSHIDVRFTKDEPNLATTRIGNDIYLRYLVGKRLASVPRNQANLWLKYEALGDFKGLSLAGGVVYNDAQPGDDLNTFMLPAYARVDGMAAYKFKAFVLPFAPDLTFQVNVRNLFGTTYYETASNRLNIVPGAPRSFLASLRAEF